MKKAFILAAVLALTLTGCRFIRVGNAEDWEFNMVRGSENLVTETMDLGPFDGVSLAISADVYYREVSDTPTVTVTAPDNIFEYFDFTVDKGVLKIRYKKDVKVVHNADITVVLAAPTLRKVTVAGSGSFVAEAPIVTGSFDASVAGSGDLSIAVLTAGEVNLAVAGSGDMRVRELSCDDLSAAIAGSGDMTLAGKAGKADLGVSGSGDMNVRSLESNEMKTSVAGSGEILR